MIPSRSYKKPVVERPSVKELWNKISEARTLINADRWRPASPAKLKADFDELETTFNVDATLAEDQRNILVAVSKEIQPSDYRGLRPPQKSYERSTYQLEMFAFRWKSAFFGGAMMYFKFCFVGKKNTNGRKCAIFSIHPHRADDDA